MALAGALHAGTSLNHLDVVVADSQATIYAYSAQTGQRSIVAQGDKLDRPYDLARNKDGNFIVSDTGTLRIVQVNPATRQQTVLAEGGVLGVPYGLDVDSRGVIYVANSQSIISIAPGRQPEVFAQGPLLQVPMDVVVGPDGALYVADALAGIIRIDPVTRGQAVLAQGNYLHQPIGITTDGKRTGYVADANGRCVVAIDLQTGSQKLVAMNGLLTTPVAVAVSSNGTLLVSDPDAFNLDGGIMMINADGSQTPLVQGSGDLVNARGFVVIR
jgi:sugar lactone lactonase YvrE